MTVGTATVQQGQGQGPQQENQPEEDPAGKEPASIPAIIGAFVFVGIGLGIDYLLWRNKATTSVIHPEDTTTVFAVTVVLAAGVERLIEPFTRWVGRAKDHVANRTVLIWGLATAVATVASAVSGFYLLHSIAGANWNGIPVWADALITGLIVGSGTKPVHDLITRAQGN
ncbi:hypothetical protein HH310_39915 [Actinoplanes sp. TBRC 11911]|uniref:hypothetical protein n=1 Tax=Actinoplanes sp. TBRC 11911 TaxID=2729386 RepID=UPI00145D63CA|nr:hypothetical protein [Actinoplanes sp. TBRC 11911]NMO57326.1 hypothetical protein [Actinoplanes sp. TBRC 11911]